jgi:hypothetical protein
MFVVSFFELSLFSIANERAIHADISLSVLYPIDWTVLPCLAAPTLALRLLLHDSILNLMQGLDGRSEVKK